MKNLTVGRPAEFTTATVGIIVGAILALKGCATHGCDDQTLEGAIVTLVSFIPALVTWWTARRQRDPKSTVRSNSDGTVAS